MFAGLVVACTLAVMAVVGGVVRRAPSPVTDVVHAVGHVRIIEGRLTGGFPFAATPSPAGPTQAGGVEWRVLAVAAALQDAINASPTSENLHALGVAAVQARRDDEAVLALEDALYGDADNASYSSDLAAAYLARRAHGGPAIDVPRALTAAARAVRLDQELPEARFNYALALSRLSLHREATRAWDDYLQAFGQEPGWGDEGRRRRAEAAGEVPAIAASPAARADAVLDAWAAGAVKAPEAALLPVLPAPDPFYTALADAIHTAHGDARRAIAQSIQDLRAAEAGFSQSQFAAGEALAVRVLARAGRVAPIAHWARRVGLTTAFYAGRAVEGRRDAERLLPELQARGFLALESDVRLRIAALDYSAGSYDLALAGYERAIAIRESLGATDTAASAHLAAAEALRMLGRDAEAWLHYLPVLGVGSIPEDHLIEHLRLVSPAAGALARGSADLALALAREAEHQAIEARNPAWLAVAAYQQARADAAIGRPQEAERAWRTAQTATAQISDLGLKRRTEAEVFYAEAEVFAARAPEDSIAAAGRAVERFQSSSTSHRLLALSVIEARAWRALGQPAGAEAALTRGVALVDEQQRAIARAEFQPSFIDASWDVFSELVDLKASQHDAEGALQWLDRGYDVGRRWARPAGAASWAEVSAEGPVVAYLSRPDVLWVWVVRHGVVSQRRLPVTHGALVDRTARLSRLLLMTGAGAAVRIETAALAAQVLWPVTQGLAAADLHRLAFVLDPTLQQVPIALLPWSKAGDRRVVDVTATVVCPSVPACASTAEPHGVARRRVAALYAAAGAGDLPDLPLARSEAERVGRRYAGARVGVATAATLSAELRAADLVHFAGHAAPDERYPGRSSLVLTDAAGRGVGVALSTLFAKGLSAQTVLLSACRTSRAEVRRGTGGTGMAGEFLRAGARHVIATQWDVQDRAASDMMDLVHEAMAGGAQPWDAVRHAQLIISADATRSLRDWAGYVAFTSASSPRGPAAFRPTRRDGEEPSLRLANY